MAKYRVKEKSFINNVLVEEGAIVEYDGEPSDNLEPVSKRAKAADAPSDEPTDPLV
jgi:hypothetical protein